MSSSPWPSTIVIVWALSSFMGCAVVQAYIPPEIKDRWQAPGYDMNKALKTIEERARLRIEEDYETHWAVRYIDRNGHKFYNTDEQRDDLWTKAQGSWELLLGFEDPRNDQYFIPYPDFREFAMAFIVIDTEKDNYFGKGIASNPDYSYVAMGGPSKVNSKTRQLYMDYQDFYLSGQLVPDWDLSFFMRGYARNWYAIERNRPPLAFTIIGVTDKVLIVRGSKTGGMAIFRKIDADMRESAFGAAEGWAERIKGFWNWGGSDRPRATP